MIRDDPKNSKGQNSISNRPGRGLNRSTSRFNTNRKRKMTIELRKILTNTIRVLSITHSLDGKTHPLAFLLEKPEQLPNSGKNSLPLDKRLTVFPL
jgi:hypothetical protein